jgi:hypothetical protein
VVKVRQQRAITKLNLSSSNWTLHGSIEFRLVSSIPGIAGTVHKIWQVVHLGSWICCGYLFILLNFPKTLLQSLSPIIRESLTTSTMPIPRPQRTQTLLPTNRNDGVCILTEHQRITQLKAPYLIQHRHHMLLGRGQRELVIGDHQTWKTTVVIGTTLDQRGSCVCFAISQRSSTVVQLVQTLEVEQALECFVRRRFSSMPHALL